MVAQVNFSNLPAQSEPFTKHKTQNTKSKFCFLSKTFNPYFSSYFFNPSFILIEFQFYDLPKKKPLIHRTCKCKVTKTEMKKRVVPRDAEKESMNKYTLIKYTMFRKV